MQTSNKNPRSAFKTLLANMYNQYTLVVDKASPTLLTVKALTSTSNRMTT